MDEIGRLEVYANLGELGRECVDFVSALRGEPARCAVSYLRVLDGAGCEDFTHEHMATLRKVVDYAPA